MVDNENGLEMGTCEDCQCERGVHSAEKALMYPGHAASTHTSTDIPGHAASTHTSTDIPGHAASTHTSTDIPGHAASTHTSTDIPGHAASTHTSTDIPGHAASTHTSTDIPGHAASTFSSLPRRGARLPVRAPRLHPRLATSDHRGAASRAAREAPGSAPFSGAGGRGSPAPRRWQRFASGPGPERSASLGAALGGGEP
ncbi:histidine-rich protein PFHRP-II-like [Apteryx rowi]|uniref:histidine-rich protein PFHRP-II-like n=1 Tax=Apteryx rowi TaxID=308060 RepID=UPI000E1E0D5C|nr:histidine-rich protein PFHRP-II-like [Apteryx rowi]